MAPIWYTGITLTLLAQVTFGVNHPLDSILSATVEKVLQGVEARLAQQGEVFKQLLGEQTEAMEARLIERIDAQETRLVDNKATMEERFAGQTVEIETKLAQHNRGMEVALESLKERVTSESRYITNTTETLLKESLSHSNTTESLLRESLVHSNTTESLLRESLVHSNTTESLLRESLAHSNTVEFLLSESFVQYNQTISELLLDLEEKVVGESRHTDKTTDIRLKDHLAQTNDTVGALLQGMEARLIALCSSQDTNELVSAVYNASKAQLHILKLLESRGQVTFLRRVDGSVNFRRNWANYTSGFGDVGSEFWLGLENLHQLTTLHQFGLRVDMEDWSGERKWAEYQSFRVGSEAGNFVLAIAGYNHKSTAGDGMVRHNKMAFSTYDRDNDAYAAGDCASEWKGGWWYEMCHWANPTGLYKLAGSTLADGVCWYNAYRDYRSFKSMSLKLI